MSQLLSVPKNCAICQKSNQINRLNKGLLNFPFIYSQNVWKKVVFMLVLHRQIDWGGLNQGDQIEITHLC